MGFVAVTFGVRAWFPGRIAVEHFDEGVYAANYFALEHLEFRYPDQHLYAPPLFPEILDWTLIVAGGNPQAVIWVNIVFGTGLAVAIGWLTRLIAGEIAAGAALLLAAFNDFLIEYSRAVLTDTPVCFFMVFAVGTGLVAIRDRHTPALFGAAIFTAVAWWTKYNGWLPLAITGAGLGGWIVFHRPPIKEIIPRIAIWLLIAALAFLLWTPCLWQLQRFGGYSAVAENHAGYVVGWRGWAESLIHQFEVQQFFSIPYASLGYVLSALVAGWLAQRLNVPGDKRFLLWITVACCLVILNGILGMLLMVILAVSGMISLRMKSAPAGDAITQSLNWWTLLAWIIGMFVATPMYRPYPRLILPLLISLIIAASIGVQQLVLILSTDKWNNRRPGRWIAGLSCTMAVLTIVFFQRLPYPQRTVFRDLAGKVLSHIENDADAPPQSPLGAIIYVLGEPGMFYHLASRQSGDFSFVANPSSNLGMLQPGATPPGIPTYLLAGPHAKAEIEELRQHLDQVELIAHYDYEASNLVLLDETPVADLEQSRIQSIELWKLLQE